MMTAPLSRAEVLAAIASERLRQDAKWGTGIPDPMKMAVVLGEECGEVAHAVLEGDAANLREELVQVAAVCVRWLESEPREGGHGG